MQYTVVHSKDPYLLARLATDLQMEGIEIFIENWCETCNPFSGFEIWMAIYATNDFSFYPHDCNHPSERRFELNNRNYIKVLTQILQP